ncbi:MAG TPA: FAD-dependent oxidoreductase [Cerasibacillus sp.]|uniref:FAD-dependent oxidoreductase n=1 Tax=Cerasibacillus sp. TaxID=2498711 RepID=UPI002F42D118
MTKEKINPEPIWRHTINLPTFPPLNENIEVDVGIVGAGITGITAAYLLTEQHGLNVAILDSDIILNGTTGHTTAKITAQHSLIYDELIKHFGEDDARLYYEAQVEASDLIKHLIEKLQIDCDLTEEDAYIFTNDEKYVKKLQSEKKAYDQLGIKGELLDQMPIDIPMKLALRMNNQAQFHPLAYLKHLVEELEKAGAKLFEKTTAVDIEFNKRPAIITEQGKRVICKNVIVASQFPFYDGQGFYPMRMYPERAYVLAVKPTTKYPGGMYINAESPTRSVRSVHYNGEELLLIIGENHKTGQGKETMHHYQALEDFAKKIIQTSEPLLRWSTQDLTTLDKVPYIGPITSTHQNVFVATGYRKWGMTNGTIAAKIISDQISGMKNGYEKLFTPSRFQMDPGLKQFATINLDVAKHMIKGKFDNTEDIKAIEKMQPGEALITRVNGNRTGVYMDENHKVHLVDTTCTHLRCEVEWNSGDHTWDCPCHGSRFSYAGEVVTGPAKKPLKRITE